VHQPDLAQLRFTMNELIIEDLTAGDGKTVVKGALITTHYTGWLEDGTEFDSSHRKGKPFQCVIGTGRVIKGWDQGLMGMQVGSLIKPNSNLIFEIELLEVLTRDD
jgi:peptidylprolyl isomerase